MSLHWYETENIEFLALSIVGWVGGIFQAMGEGRKEPAGLLLGGRLVQTGMKLSLAAHLVKLKLVQFFKLWEKQGRSQLDFC